MMGNEEGTTDSWEKKFWAIHETEQQQQQLNNRIFLNFKRQPRQPPKESSFTSSKVKKLFEFISNNEEVTNMKVLGCFEKDESEGECANEEEDEEEEEGDDEYCMDDCETRESWDSENGRTAVKEGHVFPMSRDFWYRTLNVLKAQKLDEVALEAKDIPEEALCVEVGALRPNPRTHRGVCSQEVGGGRENIFKEMEEFERKVAKPAESQLKEGFVNVYDNKMHFCRGSWTHLEKKEE